jgi:hypothetical protein
VAVEVVQLEMFQVYLSQMVQVAQVAEDQEEVSLLSTWILPDDVNM